MLRFVPVVLCVIAPLAAQAAPPEASGLESPELVRTFDAWAQALRDGQLRPNEEIQATRARDAELVASIYGELLGAGRFLGGSIENARTHAGALRDLLNEASERGGEDVARAVLRIAGASHEARLVNFSIAEVRELGHWALVRMRDVPAKATVLRYARGTVAEDTPASMQIAAIKALALRKADPLTLEIVEGRLLDADGSIRIAAAEALASYRSLSSLDILIKALRTERNTLAAQAIAEALDRTMRRHRRELTATTRRRAVTTALRRLGQTGWRGDVALLQLAGRFPIPECVPALIRVMDGAASGDQLLQTVNKKADGALRRRAWQLLKRLTGAILPENDPVAWLEFWERERDGIVLPDDATQKQGATSTFFGIPVTGNEIAFIIDTSGSMSTQIEAQDEVGLPLIAPRIEVARQQVLRAANHMRREAKYHLVTFSGSVLRWNRNPVQPTERSFRALGEVVAAFHANGGTALYDGIHAVMSSDDMETVDEIFVLTDGEPSVGIKNTDKILRSVRRLNDYRKVRIHTVHLGGEAGIELMRRLAEENDGVCVVR